MPPTIPDEAEAELADGDGERRKEDKRLANKAFMVPFFFDMSMFK